MSEISTNNLTFLVHDIVRWILLLVSWSLAAALSTVLFTLLATPFSIFSSSKTRRQYWLLCQSGKRNNQIISFLGAGFSSLVTCHVSHKLVQF